jgi:hypothetical protein
LVTLRKSRKSSEKKQLRGIVFTIQWIFFFLALFFPLFLIAFAKKMNEKAILIWKDNKQWSRNVCFSATTKLI